MEAILSLDSKRETKLSNKELVILFLPYITNPVMLVKE